MRFLKLICLIILFNSIIFLPMSKTSGATGTKTFECVGDAYIDSLYPDTNYAADDLYVSHIDIRDRESYLIFHVTDMGDVTLTEIALICSVKQLPEQSSVDWVYLIIFQTESFEEDSITWNSKPADKGEISRGKITEDIVYRIVFDSFTVKQANGNGDYYIRITTNTWNSFPLILDSRDDVWNPPKLELSYEYTPTPTNTKTSEKSSSDEASFDLFLLPLALICAIIFRKKR